MRIRLFTAKPSMRPIGETEIPDFPEPPDCVIHGDTVYLKGVVARLTNDESPYHPYVAATLAYPILETVTPYLPTPATEAGSN